MMKNIIVTGSLALDHIMDFSGRFADRIMPDAVHKISLSFLVDSLSKQFGGTAGNAAYTLKLLGAEPYILSTAGNDFASYKAHLKKHNVKTTYVHEDKKLGTGSYFVVTDQDGNQIGSFYTGAMAKNDELRLSAVKGTIDMVLIMPNMPKAMTALVAESQKRKLPYMYDPAFQIATFTPEELKIAIEGAAILIGNDYEIALIEEKLDVSHEDIRVMVPVVVTTLGSKGSVVETRRESIHVKPAKPKNTSDPTGAGDAYRAGFVAGYTRGYDLVTCGQMGSVAAVYTVETYGTQTHHFTKKEFVKRYRENYGQDLKL